MSLQNLPWIVLLTPLVSAVLITFFLRRLQTVAAGVSVLAVLVSLIGSVYLFKAPDFAASVPWISVGDFNIALGFQIDLLAKTMLLVVTVVGALVHLYSLGYMAEDDGKWRFFAGLSLFMFSMLGIVLADNFIMMFIFWELVGVSSYVLIGHWFTKPAPPAAANKAFMTNRIGDFGFMLGILLVWLHTGAIGFAEIKENLPALTGSAFLTIAVLCVFCGTLGKSAQFPLHVWLPDAMEGPTPVSALIHAATMVAAGVYMLARVFFLIEAAPDAQTVILWIGAITALGAALMATQQNDIKRILAYSTLSQLGYMVMAIGAVAQTAAMFHLFTHAFFKALLFLGAGSVIHAAHHEQDIWKMGGLSKKMPLTFVAFALGTMALIGFPGLSGFFSKDMILLAIHEKNHLVFYMALFTAFLTAFYMMRLFVVVFFGKGRTHAADHAHESPMIMVAPLLILAVPSVIAGYSFISHHFFVFEHAEHAKLVPALAIGAFVLGSLAGWILYTGKTKDPFEIRLFARKFYIDEMYEVLIRWTQELLATVSAFIDKWIIDGVLVQGSSRVVYGVGFALRFLQVGNLQAYAFLFGLGVIGLLIFVIFG